MDAGENSIHGLIYQMLNYGCLNLSYQVNINHFADVSKMVGGCPIGQTSCTGKDDEDASEKMEFQ